MIRELCKSREDWMEKLESVGVTYHSSGLPPVGEQKGGLWWDETVRWHLSSEEVDRLDDATAELHALCMSTVDHIIRREPGLLVTLFGFKEWMADYVCRSWLRADPSLMGRMDLAYDPETLAVKLLEYNADTPTLAIETALVQWQWLQDTMPDADQFNSLHEALLSAFQGLAPRIAGRRMHFSAFKDFPEEWAHLTYYRDLAQQASITTSGMDIAAVRWNGQSFLDDLGMPVQFLHMLYPWEWIEADEFGPHLAKDTLGKIEPPWKAVVSHKAFLTILWRLHPGHPNLLEAMMGSAPAQGHWAEKPALGREGGNVRLMEDGVVTAETTGTYGDGVRVSQAFAPMLSQDGWTTVIGSWVADGRPAGIIFRESATAVVADVSRVVPHFFT